MVSTFDRIVMNSIRSICPARFTSFNRDWTDESTLFILISDSLRHIDRYCSDDLYEPFSSSCLPAFHSKSSVLWFVTSFRTRVNPFVFMRMIWSFFCIVWIPAHLCSYHLWVFKGWFYRIRWFNRLRFIRIKWVYRVWGYRLGVLHGWFYH